MKRHMLIFAVVALALLIWNTGGTGQTPATSSLPPDLQELVTLAQNNISDETIISYIRNSGKTYRLTAADIVNLGRNGVSQNVIARLIQSPSSSTSTSPVVTAPVAAVEPSVPPASPEYFEAQLAPYGEWIYVPEFGTRCWFPSGLSPDWRPYFDSGHWLYTDNGMYWESDYPWGAIPFHYGRWIYRGNWVWVPAYEYAPAWVVWRHTKVTWVGRRCRRARCLSAADGNFTGARSRWISILGCRQRCLFLWAASMFLIATFTGTSCGAENGTKPMRAVRSTVSHVTRMDTDFASKAWSAIT